MVQSAKGTLLPSTAIEGTTVVAIQIAYSLVEMQGIPFAAGETAHSGLKKRARKYLEFIDEFPEPILDIGMRNQVTELVEEGLCSPIEGTQESEFNFDFRTNQKTYGTVLCFEVLEHIMNPLNFMLNIHKLLPHDGVLYISTPKLFLGVLQSPHHFTEYKIPKAEILFEYAGFRIEKRSLCVAYPLWWGTTGFRPAFRVLFHRTVTWKLRKP